MPFLRRRGQGGRLGPSEYASQGFAGYRYRIERRDSLLARLDLASGLDGGRTGTEAGRLAHVLESLSLDGWKLISVSDGEFYFRRRG